MSQDSKRSKVEQSPVPSPVTQAPESDQSSDSSYWGQVFGNRRRRAFAIRFLVENARADVETMLLGKWPEGVAEPK